ncbi:MAG TPA: DUF433 domain-containing protein [Aggregatilineales bacterium]|nr:DUF433 domain-containing protein [Aggregatilineales bacterium]
MDTKLAIEHLVVDPEIRGGRPRILGKGITVHDIAGDYNSELTVDYIVDAFDLTPGQVYAALSYYFDHKEQIDQEIADKEAAGKALMEELIREGKAETFEDFRKRIEARRAAKQAEQTKRPE